MFYSWCPLWLSQVTKKRDDGSTLKVYDASTHIYRRHFQNHFTESYQLWIWHLNLHSEKFSFSMSAHALHMCLLHASCKWVISKLVSYLVHVFFLVVFCFFLFIFKNDHPSYNGIGLCSKVYKTPCGNPNRHGLRWWHLPAIWPYRAGTGSPNQSGVGVCWSWPQVKCNENRGHNLLHPAGTPAPNDNRGYCD